MTDLSRLTASVASRYRIERELGAGGMATVYLARDLKHDRDVAIKVLHPDLGITLGGERFLSEIKTTAKLQHPHILPLLDSGEADGLLYYVMPLMTGETLRARLERERQLPVADAVLIAREAADALAYAHGLGVIHRDIKPENILLQNGHALVADFGIALAVQAAGGARMTQTGLSLGTPQYMSPEQAMGERTIDTRSDIYALGAVTYEMLAGEPPFTGPTVQAIVARLLSEEPRSLSAQRKAIPPSVEHATMRALEKLPADRFAAAHEFAAALISDLPAAARTGARHSARSTSARSWWMLAGGVVLLGVGVVVGRLVSTPAVSYNSSRHVSIALPDSMRVTVSGNLEAPGGLGSVTISGDGSRIVWVGTALVGGNQGVRLYVRDMQSFLIKAVPGSEGAFAPFLSDDGAVIGYFSGGELRTANVRSGETRVLQRDFRSPIGGAFLADGSVLVTLESSAATIVSPSGSSRQLVRSQAQDPSVAPGGIGFASIVPGDRYAIGVQRGGPMQVLSIADGALRALRPFGAAGSDSGSGIVGGAPKVIGQRLYWLEHDVVMTANLDAENARLTSQPSSVIDGVRGDLFGAADYDVAADGTLVFVAGADPAIGRLAWLDDKVRADTLPLPAADYIGFDIAPDGRSLLTKAITSSGSEVIRLVDLERSTGTNLNVGAGTTSQPGWSADGRAALLSIMPGGPASARIIRVPIDNRSTYDTLLTGSLARQAISRDGRLTVLQVLSDRSANTYLTGHEASKLYASTNGGPFEELPSLRGVAAPALSPDGRWIAYERASGSRTETFIERFPPDGRATIVSGDGGYEPIFSAKGDKLFFRRARGVMVVELTPGDPIKLGKSRSYVQFDFADFLGRAYKVGNDDRLLVKLLPSMSPQSEIRVVLGAGRGK